MYKLYKCKNKKKTDYQTKNYQKYFYSENIGNQRKTRKENFHIDSISSLSLSLSISISPKPSELRALSYLYYDKNNRTQPIIY